MRAGSNYPCHEHYDSTTPGDAWPGGCFGEWNGSAAVAQTLRGIPSSPALSPGTARESLRTGNSGLALNWPRKKAVFLKVRIRFKNTVICSGPGAYAALRTSGLHGAVVVVNVAAYPSTVEIELTGTVVARPQTPTSLITKEAGPAVGVVGAWRVPLPAHGWAAFDVVLNNDLSALFEASIPALDTPHA